MRREGKIKFNIDGFNNYNDDSSIVNYDFNYFEEIKSLKKSFMLIILILFISIILLFIYTMV